MKKKLCYSYKSFKTIIRSWISSKKVHRLNSIKFNQKAWLKSYIDMNAKLRTEAKMILKKIFSS